MRVRRAARAESLLDVAADVSDDLLDGIEPQLLRVGAHLRGDVPELSPEFAGLHRGAPGWGAAAVPTRRGTTMTLVAHRARSRESARGRCERARREVRLEATFRHLRADGNNTATPRPAAGSTTTAAVPRKCRKMRTRADGTRFARRHARPRIVHDTTRRRARRVRRVTSRASRRADGDDNGDNRRARSRARDRAFCRWKIDAVGARRSLSCQCATSSPRTRAFGLPRDPEPARRRPRLLARHDARDGRRWRRLGRERNPRTPDPADEDASPTSVEQAKQPKPGERAPQYRGVDITGGKYGYGAQIDDALDATTNPDQFLFGFFFLCGLAIFAFLFGPRPPSDYYG